MVYGPRVHPGHPPVWFASTALQDAYLAPPGAILAQSIESKRFPNLYAEALESAYSERGHLPWKF